MIPMFKSVLVTKKIVVTLFVFLGFTLGCTHGHCPDPKAKVKPKAERIWVYKYDQSKQCDLKPGISLESMQKDFNEMKIQVYDSKKQYDGLMRIQACGAFTGLANLFLISIEDLDKANSRGYQQWDFN